MKIIFFSTNIDIIDEWKKRYSIAQYTACYDLISLEKELEKDNNVIVICDYDSVAQEINKLISSNKLPNNAIVLERVPELATGKMLIFQRVKAYGNTRMLPIHFTQMVETVTEGKSWTYPELTAALIKTKENITINEDGENLIENRLTQKEIEVVYLILKGFTNDAIASKLAITQRTVKAHVSSIFTKLHVNDRLSLVLLLK